MDVEGIVLKVVPYKEKDAIITILTEMGFSSFLARGILKIDSKNAFLTNIYTHAIFELQEAKNGYFSLKSGKILNSPSFLMNDLNLLLALDAIDEMILKFLDESTSSSLYHYLKNGLSLLKTNRLAPMTFIATIAIKCLENSGYKMQVDGCVICNKTKNIVAFDFNDGGFICDEHFDSTTHINHRPSYLKAIRQLFLVPFDKLDKLDISSLDIHQILHEINDFILSNSGVYLKGIDLLFKANTSK